MDISRITEQFNKVASAYDSGRRNFIHCYDDYYTTSIAMIASIKPLVESILDLGAGTGLLSQHLFLAYPNARYTLVDVSSDMLSVAKERFSGCPGVDIRVEDYTQGLPEGSFDMIASALSIHHLPEEAKTELYRAVYAKLPRSGIFINLDQFRAHSPEIDEGLTRFWLDQIRSSGIGECEWNAWQERRKLDRENTMEESIGLLRQAGFQTAESIYQYHKFAVIIAIKE